jgi:hypothetical protein
MHRSLIGAARPGSVALSLKQIAIQWNYLIARLGSTIDEMEPFPLAGRSAGHGDINDSIKLNIALNFILPA